MSDAKEVAKEVAKELSPAREFREEYPWTIS